MPFSLLIGLLNPHYIELPLSMTQVAISLGTSTLIGRRSFSLGNKYVRKFLYKFHNK